MGSTPPKGECYGEGVNWGEAPRRGSAPSVLPSQRGLRSKPSRQNYRFAKQNNAAKQQNEAAKQETEPAKQAKLLVKQRSLAAKQQL